MNKILNFLIETQKLKELRRVGWVLMGVEKAETVASHTFRLAIFAVISGSMPKRLERRGTVFISFNRKAL